MQQESLISEIEAERATIIADRNKLKSPLEKISYDSNIRFYDDALRELKDHYKVPHFGDIRFAFSLTQRGFEIMYALKNLKPKLYHWEDLRQLYIKKTGRQMIRCVFHKHLTTCVKKTYSPIKKERGGYYNLISPLSSYEEYENEDKIVKLLLSMTLESRRIYMAIQELGKSKFSTKEIYESYTNLTGKSSQKSISSLLSIFSEDLNIPIERACKGYYRYLPLLDFIGSFNSKIGNNIIAWKTFPIVDTSKEFPLFGNKESAFNLTKEQTEVLYAFKDLESKEYSFDQLYNAFVESGRKADREFFCRRILACSRVPHSLVQRTTKRGYYKLSIPFFSKKGKEKEDIAVLIEMFKMLSREERQIYVIFQELGKGKYTVDEIYKIYTSFNGKKSKKAFSNLLSRRGSNPNFPLEEPKEGYYKLIYATENTMPSH